jgi:hypothetical protein
MRRATECFSMYSDMSTRISAVSSSNRNAASALVSSVLPTPVGPRNMNEPIGRFGSWSPARARRTAVETASTASRCPMTRLPIKGPTSRAGWHRPFLYLRPASVSRIIGPRARTDVKGAGLQGTSTSGVSRTCNNSLR